MAMELISEYMNVGLSHVYHMTITCLYRLFHTVPNVPHYSSKPVLNIIFF